MSRITREGRRPLGDVAIDGRFLGAAAAEQQGLLIDECGLDTAASLLCRAAPVVRHGIVWVVAADEPGYRLIREKADACWGGRSSSTPVVMCDVHHDLPNAAERGAASYRMLLMDAGLLRGRTNRNVRRRDDVLKVFAPLIAIVDPDLRLCSLSGSWDPAWAVRDAVARLCTHQPGVALAIFTEREALSIASARVCSAFGVSGLMYFDGSSQGSF